MIVFDASTLVSATFRRDSMPDLAVRHAFRMETIAISPSMMAELLDVLHRPRLARFIEPDLRAGLLGQLSVLGIVWRPTIPVTDCRDPKDNRYLELAQAGRARLIVRSDNDLLVLHPWRGIPILRPAQYLAEAEGRV